MHVLVVKADVIYLNIFTIKHMNKPTCCVLCGAGSRVGEGGVKTQDGLMSVGQKDWGGAEEVWRSRTQTRASRSRAKELFF